MLAYLVSCADAGGPDGATSAALGFEGRTFVPGGGGGSIPDTPLSIVLGGTLDGGSVGVDGGGTMFTPGGGGGGGSSTSVPSGGRGGGVALDPGGGGGGGGRSSARAKPAFVPTIATKTNPMVIRWRTEDARMLVPPSSYITARFGAASARVPIDAGATRLRTRPRANGVSPIQASYVLGSPESETHHGAIR